jgi:hypothetical protein
MAAKVFDLGTQIQFIRTDGTVNFYYKRDLVSEVICMTVRVENGLLEVLKNGVVVESFMACQEIDNLNAASLADQAEAINAMINGGVTPGSGITGSGVDQSVARFDGVTSIEESDWYINDAGVLYPLTDPQDIGILGSNRVGNIYMSSRIDFDSNLELTSATIEKFKFDSAGVFTINQAYSFPTADGTPGQTLQTDGAGNVTFSTPASGVTTFTGLSDTPGSFAGAGLDFVRVNAGATALEFTDASSINISTFNNDSGFITNSIYDGSGSLSGATTVTMGGSNITWSGGSFIFGASQAIYSGAFPSGKFAAFGFDASNDPEIINVDQSTGEFLRIKLDAISDGTLCYSDGTNTADLFVYGKTTGSALSSAATVLQTTGVIINSDGSTINSNVENSAIIGGAGITATKDNYLYVPNMEVEGGVIIMDANTGVQSNTGTILNFHGFNGSRFATMGYFDTSDNTGSAFRLDAKYCYQLEFINLTGNNDILLAADNSGGNITAADNGFDTVGVFINAIGSTINQNVEHAVVAATQNITATVNDTLYAENFALNIGTPLASYDHRPDTASNNVKSITGKDQGSFSIEGNWYKEQFSNRYRTGFGTNNTRQQHEFFWQGNIDTVTFNVNPSTGLMAWTSTDASSIMTTNFDLFVSDANEIRFGGGATTGSAKFFNTGTNTDGKFEMATKIDGTFANRIEIDDRGGFLVGDLTSVTTSRLGLMNYTWISRGGVGDAQLTSSTGTAFVTDSVTQNSQWDRGWAIELLSGAQSGEIRRVTTVSDDTNGTLESAFSVDQVSAVDMQVIPNIASWADHNGDNQFRMTYEGKLGLGLGTTLPNSILHLGTSTEEVEIVDAGSAGATEQDWIEVNVGGVQGYIRVYATV